MQWTGSLMHTIPKPGKSAVSPDGWRSILLLEADCKAVLKALRPGIVSSLDRARPLSKFGGLPGRPLSLPAAFVRAHLVSLKQQGISGGAVFLDVKSAYYSIIRDFVTSTQAERQDVDSISQRVSQLFVDREQRQRFVEAFQRVNVLERLWTQILPRSPTSRPTFDVHGMSNAVIPIALFRLLLARRLVHRLLMSFLDFCSALFSTFSSKRYTKKACRLRSPGLIMMERLCVPPAPGTLPGQMTLPFCSRRMLLNKLSLPSNLSRPPRIVNCVNLDLSPTSSPTSLKHCPSFVGRALKQQGAQPSARRLRPLLLLVATVLWSPSDWLLKTPIWVPSFVATSPRSPISANERICLGCLNPLGQNSCTTLASLCVRKCISSASESFLVTCTVPVSGDSPLPTNSKLQLSLCRRSSVAAYVQLLDSLPRASPTNSVQPCWSCPLPTRCLLLKGLEPRASWLTVRQNLFGVPLQRTEFGFRWHCLHSTKSPWRRNALGLHPSILPISMRR